MRTSPATGRPHARRGPRLAAAALALLGLAACGAPEPTWRQFTATQWARRLWSIDKKELAEAQSALVLFSKKAPEVVVPAVARELSKPPPEPPSTTFALAIDPEGTRRLGLAPAATAEVARVDVPVLQARTQSLRLPVAGWRIVEEGKFEMGLPGRVPRADVVRLQGILAARGALALRSLYADPAALVAPGRPAGKALPGGEPYARRLEGEAARRAKAARDGEAYVPADPRVRAVPLAAATTPSAPADFVLVEEPATEDEGFGDRRVASAWVDRDLDGRPFVVLQVKRADVEATRRALDALAGSAVAVVVDDVLRAVIPAPILSGGDRLTLPLWRSADAAADAEAVDLAVVLGSGRLDRPLRAVPPPTDLGVGPPAENVISQTLVDIGDPAAETLDRLAKEAPHEWTRRSAAWARERIRAKRPQ